MIVWMEITTDDLQLPVVVADTRKELARLCRVEPVVITCSMYHAAKGNRPPKYIAVEVEDEP